MAIDTIFRCAGVVLMGVLAVAGSAAAQQVTVEGGKIVPKISDAERSSVTAATRQSRSRSSADLDNQQKLIRALNALSAAKLGLLRRHLKIPIVILSPPPPPSRHRAAQRRLITVEIGIGAAKTLVMDETGDWYQLSYDVKDDELEITQFCTREIEVVPDHVLKGAKLDERRARSGSGSAEAEVSITPETYEKPAQISIRYVAHDIPCNLKILCGRKDDPICSQDRYVRDFVRPEGRTLIYVPPVEGR